MSRLRTTVLVAVIVLSGIASARVAVDQQRQEGVRAGVAKPRPDLLGRDYRYERLNAPARTVVRDEHGAVVAMFTDGARTAAITGLARTFTEPAKTPAVVTTPVWARLVPRPWQRDAEREEWFRPWLDAAVADRSDDVLAIATQYLGTAPLDAAGYVRLVFGDRLGYPVRDTPAAMSDTGVPIETTPVRLALQPGDLLFFDTGKGSVDHVGLFVGLDQAGRPRFVSSRKAEGPTLADEGASFDRKRGSGAGLRGVRRL
ncbi:NlpC/P60 family protein [Lentzea sp. NPDC051838]|uniref:C40 family peptidase n=1 Tax=Lentzea sp. NPDC051838 TaxID=3154849 RepID=UPI0034145F07